MASVFVVRSRRPLLHYYSYPARRGYRRLTRAGYAESNRAAPLARLKGRGEGRTRSPAPRVYARGVTAVDVAHDDDDEDDRERERERERPVFSLHEPVENQGGTTSRPSVRPAELRVRQ